MAAALKAAKKMKIDYLVGRDVYDAYVKACSHKGYTPHVVIERLMKKFIETGQM